MERVVDCDECWGEKVVPTYEPFKGDKKWLRFAGYEVCPTCNGCGHVRVPVVSGVQESAVMGEGE